MMHLETCEIGTRSETSSEALHWKMIINCGVVIAVEEEERLQIKYAFKVVSSSERDYKVMMEKECNNYSE